MPDEGTKFLGATVHVQSRVVENFNHHLVVKIRLKRKVNVYRHDLLLIVKVTRNSFQTNMCFLKALNTQAVIKPFF